MRIREYEHYIRDLLELDDIQELRKTHAHGRRDRFVHNYAVGKLAYRLARLLNGNATIAARAGFLHDWYHGHRPERKRFSFSGSDQHHFRISHEAAANYGEHTEVLHAIRTHFWPWGRVAPKSREAWAVWMADNLVWVVDYWQSAKISLRHGYQNFMYGEVSQ